jgi:hypothetical protein
MDYQLISAENVRNSKYSKQAHKPFMQKNKSISHPNHDDSVLLIPSYNIKEHPKTDVFTSIFDEGLKFKELIELNKSDDEIEEEQKQIQKFRTEEKQARQARK